MAREWLAKISPTWVDSHADKMTRRFEVELFPWLGAFPIKDIKAAELLAVIRRSKPGGPTRISRSLQILNRRGENRQIECTASVMRDSGDKPDRILLLQRDVTLEKQFHVKYFLAERMATVGVLAEGVAHEINNPLTSLSGFAETLVLRLGELETLVPKSENASALFEDV